MWFILPDHFGEDIAAHYDEDFGPWFDQHLIEQTVDLLTEFAGDGAALEFAVGTGRIALPLAARGVPLSGIELSSAMAERLRSKEGSERVSVTVGDMAITRVHGGFRLSTGTAQLASWGHILRKDSHGLTATPNSGLRPVMKLSLTLVPLILARPMAVP